MSSADSNLQAWFRRELEKPLPIPADVPPVAIRRYWEAGSNCVAVPTGVRRRHPAMGHILPTVKAYKIGPSVRTWSRGRRCRFFSWKADHTLRLDSTLEMDRALYCEIDPEVTQIVAHPFSIAYDQGGLSKIYTPDLFVCRSDRKVIDEVKFEVDASSAQNIERWPCIANALNRIGFDFEVITELSIRHPTTRRNVELVFAHRMAPLPNREGRGEIIDFVRRRGRVSGDDLLCHFPNLGFGTLLALVRHGFLATDLSQPINSHSEFWRGLRPKATLLRKEMYHAEMLL